MGDTTGCVMDEYFIYDSDSTPIDLPVTLTELLDDLSIPGSFSSRFSSEYNGSAVPSVRHSIDDGCVDITVDHVAHKLDDVTLGDKGITALAATPYYLPLPVATVPAASHQYTRWSTPICRFERGQVASSVCPDIQGQLSGMYSNPGVDHDIAYPGTTYDKPASDGDKSVGHTTTYSGDSQEWDSMARSVPSGVSTLSTMPDGYNPHSLTFDGTVRNMHFGYPGLQHSYLAMAKSGLVPVQPHPTNRSRPDKAANAGPSGEPSVSTDFSKLSSEKLNAENEFRRTSLCKYWQRGICQNADCNFAHGKKELKGTVGVWKTTLCHHWMNGTCRMGADCRHAHGEEELQPKNIPLNVLKNKILNTIRLQESAYNAIGHHSQHNKNRKKSSANPSTPVAAASSSVNDKPSESAGPNRRSKRRTANKATG
ncbi:zinc finger CCCH type motif-containing protein protein [Babesia ovis]|uniref:Zinc finger CCCH type motif-containing protein protein n=1 Tax=Babesia ovis TaxID=5869 RepID=A0A9W5TBD4_BABOV|nr:zinc finger CCCH type motif-containing protein protein [Babesia ovis]